MNICSENRHFDKGGFCPCKSSKPFNACCGPFLCGKAAAGTPEQLMRSRYSAFCLKKADYLIQTRHPSKRTPQDREQLVRMFRSTRWEGLKVLNTQAGECLQDQGLVEFAAFFQTDAGAGQLHECSRFVRENNAWFYVDGDILPPLTFKRNEPCWCGSGKKYKRCHAE